MKVWTEVLTVGQLHSCAYAVNAEFPGCAVYLLDHKMRMHNGPRVRRIDGVSLRSTYNRRHPNSGTEGSEWGGTASWTEWGWFLARVFERDPDARCGDYRGKDDFHWQTSGRFLDPRSPRERQVLVMLKSQSTLKF